MLSLPGHEIVAVLRPLNLIVFGFGSDELGFNRMRLGGKDDENGWIYCGCFAPEDE